MPVIVSVHGGWVYGNKEIMQFYCMSLKKDPLKIMKTHIG